MKRFDFVDSEMLLSLVAFTEDISVTMSIYDEIVPYVNNTLLLKNLFTTYL